MAIVRIYYLLLCAFSVLIFSIFASELGLLPIFYCLNLVFLLRLAFQRKQGYLYFVLSPHFICLCYILFSYAAGSFLLLNDISFSLRQIEWFKSTDSHSLMFLYNNMAFAVIFLSYKEKQHALGKFEWKIRLNWIWCLIIFILISFLHFDASLFGGSGDLTIVPKYVIVVFLIGWISKNGFRNRWLYYLVIICLISASSYSSKRESLMILFFIIMFEHSYILSGLRNILRIGLYCVLSSIVVAVFVLSMSIMRGYGNYPIGSYFDTFRYIPDYISNPENVKYIAANFELNQSYYNSNRPIDIIISEPNKIAFGSNYIKTLLLPLPRSIFPDKPLSALRAYTKEENLNFFNAGGSYPINPIAESFWAFGFGGIVVLACIFLLFNRMYNFLLIELRSPRRLFQVYFLVYIYGISFMFYRGSGLDLLVIYIIFFIFFYILFSVFVRPVRVLKLSQKTRISAVST